MTERIDHVNTAVGELTEAWESAEDLTGADFVNALIANAQAHATLALVEQQRIANLIAYETANHEFGLTFNTAEHAALGVDR